MSEVTEKFNYIKEHILKWEGGYVECKDGSDYKCTCMGISIDLYRYYYGYDKDCDDLQVIKENEWDYIFRKEFYERMKCEDIHNWSIAVLCMDMCFMSGCRTAIKRIQRSLGVGVDGIVGPQTLRALNFHNSRLIFNRLWRMRELWLNELTYRKPIKKKYLRGWLNRLNDVKYDPKGDWEVADN